MRKTKRTQKNIVLGVTASIAAYKACEITRKLKEHGYEVTVVMTPDAQEFIRPLLFQSLSGRRVYRGLFTEPCEWEIGHISLAQSANLLLIAPATADIIAKMAGGICDDLLTCVALATKAPVLVCPAMNENMYTNPLTQANIKKLASLGYKFVGPRIGRLACGKEGIGCLEDVDTIIKEAKRVLDK